MIAQDKLIEKINALPPGKVAEAIDFVDFLSTRRDRGTNGDRFAMIVEYAAINAGTDFDLDLDLESAAIENLLTSDEAFS